MRDWNTIFRSPFRTSGGGSGGPPSGAAGGSLSGNYPNPGLAAGLNPMVKLFDSTLGAAAASFDITAIPATYAVLRALLLLRGDNNSNFVDCNLTMNGDAAGHYDWQSLIGFGASSAAAHTDADTRLRASNSMPGLGGVANSFGIVVVEIIGYANTVTFKPVFAQSFGHATATTDQAEMAGGVWHSTAAINELTFAPSAGNWVANSRCILYGIGVS